MYFSANPMAWPSMTLTRILCCPLELLGTVMLPDAHCLLQCVEFIGIKIKFAHFFLSPLWVSLSWWRGECRSLYSSVFVTQTIDARLGQTSRQASSTIVLEALHSRQRNAPPPSGDSDPSPSAACRFLELEAAALSEISLLPPHSQVVSAFFLVCWFTVPNTRPLHSGSTLFQKLASSRAARW